MASSNYTSIAANIAAKSDGTVWVWGYNGVTQSTPVQISGLTGVIAVGTSVNQTTTTLFTALRACSKSF